KVDLPQCDGASFVYMPELLGLDDRPGGRVMRRIGICAEPRGRVLDPFREGPCEPGWEVDGIEGLEASAIADLLLQIVREEGELGEVHPRLPDPVPLGLVIEQLERGSLRDDTAALERHHPIHPWDKFLDSLFHDHERVLLLADQIPEEGT